MSIHKVKVTLAGLALTQGTLGAIAFQWWKTMGRNDDVVRLVDAHDGNGIEYDFDVLKPVRLMGWHDNRLEELREAGRNWALTHVTTAEDGFSLLVKFHVKTREDWVSFRKGCNEVWGQPLHGQSKISPRQEVVKYVYHMSTTKFGGERIMVRVNEQLDQAVVFDTVRCQLLAIYPHAVISFVPPAPRIAWKEPLLIL